MTVKQAYTEKAIRTGDIFSANQRDKFSFYGGSYNFTLKELAESLTIEELTQ